MELGTRKIIGIGNSLGLTVPLDAIKKTRFHKGCKVKFVMINKETIQLQLVNTEKKESKVGKRVIG